MRGENKQVEFLVGLLVWAIVALVAAKLATAPGDRHASTEEAQDAELDEARPAATGIRPWLRSSKARAPVLASPTTTCPCRAADSPACGSS